MTEEITSVTSAPQTSEIPVVYAGFLKRVAAYLIDSILFAIMIILAIIALLKLPKESAGWLVLLAICGCYLCYFVWPECSSWQATLGKKIFGLKVTNTHGQRISFWRSFLRNIGMKVSQTILYIGFLMCLWTKKKQCLHDMIADCVVVDTNPHAKQGCAIGVAICLLFGPFSLGMLAAIVLPQYVKAVEKARAVETIVLLSHIAQAQQRTLQQTGRYATDFQQLDIDARGVTGPVFYTKGDPRTGANGNGFEVGLSQATTGNDGFVVAVRQTPHQTDQSISYTLWRTYTGQHTSCIPHNDPGAQLCARICQTEELGPDGSCCTDGTPGRCEP